jgi:PhzF family phenazine biosynthesis protein
MGGKAVSYVDVFGAAALTGNPVAVVHDAAGLDTAAMAAFARWTNLSETTFLLPPENPAADYRLRIFTPGASSLRAGSCRLRGTRRLALPTRGCVLAGSRRTRTASCRNAA